MYIRMYSLSGSKSVCIYYIQSRQTGKDFFFFFFSVYEFETKTKKCELRFCLISPLMTDRTIPTGYFNLKKIHHPSISRAECVCAIISDGVGETATNALLIAA